MHSWWCNCLFLPRRAASAAILLQSHGCCGFQIALRQGVTATSVVQADDCLCIAGVLVVVHSLWFIEAARAAFAAP